MASGKKIVIYSTSDGQEGSLYDKMLDETSKLNQYYADKYSHTYKTFRGLKVGNVAANAMYNKVYLAKEELDAGEYDWFVCLDADSYIWHMENDFIDLLIESYGDKFMMKGKMGDGPWSWSSPLFVNLKHEYSSTLLDGWIGEIDKVSSDILFSLLSVKERTDAQKHDRDLMYDYLQSQPEGEISSLRHLNNNQFLFEDQYTSYENSIFIQHFGASTETELKLGFIETRVTDRLLSLGI
tara:strand:+ start:57 stop:773 length:717 start_codon:yes stop_codon:yes gene_type:complete